MPTSGNTVKFFYDDGIAIPYIVRAWLLLIPNILSLICSVFTLFHLLCDSTLRKGLHNHAIIVILIMCIIWASTTVPWIINSYFVGIAWIQTPTFCIIWKFLDSSIYTTIAKLVAWTSVERHILIFHDRLVRTKTKRYLIHYLPITFIIIYGIVLYAIITPMNDCGRNFYYFIPWCAYYSCIYESAAFSLYEFFSGGILSSLLIGFGSLFLILRIVTQKHRVRQQMNWKKHRKMTLQLLSITSIFFVLYLPPVLLAMAWKIGVPTDVGATYSTYSIFFSYYIEFLLPFACLTTIPHLRTRVRNTLRCHGRRHARAVAPEQSARKPAAIQTQKQKTTTV